MILRYLQSFRADYERLPREIQARVKETILLFQDNPRHPSLHTKKMKGTRDVWEARVSHAYRLTFDWEGDVVILRRVGPHDILKKETK